MYDDLISDILNDTEKPQVEKPEAFLVEQEKPLTKPVKAETTKEKKEENDEEFLKWAKVPARKKNPYCGYCKQKMPGGTWGWRSDCEDNRGKVEVYWWCQKCLDGIMTPPKK